MMDGGVSSAAANIRQRDQLTTRRTTLLAQLDRAERFIVQYEAGRDELEVPLRMENLDVLWASLEEVQVALEDLETTSEGKTANLETRALFEPKLFRIKANLKAKLPPPILPQANRPDPPSRVPSTLSSLKLPTISLPEFDGDYRQWLTFHDTFQALIHDNDELPVIQKFHYLRAALKGEAAQLIESIAISAANYPLAWDSLISRYSNEYLLKKRHLQDLMDVPRMKKETAVALHSTLDEFQRHVKILKQLGEPTDAWSTLLEHLLCSKLHDETIKAWEDHAATVDDQSYSCLVEFLEKRVRVLESISANHHGNQPAPASQPSGSHFRKPFIKMSSHSVTESSFPKCHACDNRHALVRCPRFMAMAVAEKLRLVNSKRLCVNCFRQDHFARDCSSNYTCRVCRKRHHSLLHLGFASGSNQPNQDSPSNVPSASTSSTLPSNSSQNNDQRRVQSASAIAQPSDVQSSNVARDTVPTVFMLTVVLKIVDAYGKEHYARALLDGGSQPNLMTDRMAQLLRLKRQKFNVQVQGIGEKPEYANESVSTEIRSRKGEFARNVTFLILRKLTSSLPSCSVPVYHWKLPKDLFLADPEFNRSSDVDLILGSQHFFDCFPTAARIQLSDSLPILVDSEFGWIVAGGAHLVPPSMDSVCCKTVTVSVDPLEKCMEKFWSVEELPMRSAFSVEEKACEDYYVSTVSRTQEGRYVVRYPKRENFSTMIGESKSTALRRFSMLEGRFSKNPGLQESYESFMAEYLSMGHMRQVQEGNNDVLAYYLPHHPVIKEASTTTKTRVVFDGSSKTSTGHSLNEALCVGPVVQDDLLTLVIRFRKFPVAVVADIAKMYRQVLIHPEDAPLQRIVWGSNPSQPPATFELQTVTYGLAPSSYLATRTLQQLAEDEGHAYPLGKPALTKSFYVDDFIGGANSISEAIQLRVELTDLLAKGGFPIRKWTSNKLEVLQGLDADSIGTQSSVRFDPDETVKTLGICWEPERDQFRFNYHVSQTILRATKRSILSAISQLFDPLGLVAPIVVRGKMLMQELWLIACSWDDEVPDIVKQKWETFYHQLSKLSEFRIQRYAFQANSVVQLHTFADASEAAYGACIYARSVDPEGRVTIQLLAAKTRVAPLKRLSLPRLELCAAVVAAQLHGRVNEALDMNIASSFFWSDSTVTLQWLKSPPNTWKTFVANRVSEIQTTTHGARWNHVAGSQNPVE
ncbi:uncharacterized protein LOC115266910 [Aedes albopictus]|uniref:Peptidase aspartic putative domain-containing protein n=1 Tax=Aedes albopictus TaxID=7160 RepID=A0ABM1YP78_AEDAL